MAIGTAFVTTAMPDLTNWVGEVVSYDATNIVISDGVRSVTYSGAFTYDTLGNVFGTITGIVEFRNGAPIYSLTNVNVDATVYFNALATSLDLAASVVLADADALTGSDGNDTLRSYGGDDILYGGDGRDKLYGEAGNDNLYGGVGRDKLYGGVGRDKLFGEVGNDKIFGGVGNDELYGGAGNDSLYGGNGRDKLYGGANSDSLYGQTGNDRLKGGAGGDTLFGGDGNDVLYGGNGKDILDGGDGDDTMTGGAGNDVFVFSNGADTITDFDTTTNKEKIDLSSVVAISNFSNLKNNFATEIAGDVVIDDGQGNTLTLQDVALADLSAGDFLF